jgi:hypothetical protein
MPYLRKIRKSKWYKNENPPWLNPDEIQADALVDIGTQSNELSVYYVDDQKTCLDQVAVALALLCNYVSNLDYVLIREDDLDDARIKVRPSPNHGQTPDDIVNSQHCDIYEVSAQKLLALAAIIKNSEIGRITEPNLRRKAARALFEKRMDRTKIRLSSESIQSLDELAKQI